jgi:hypothetical protein
LHIGFCKEFGDFDENTVQENGVIGINDFPENPLHHNIIFGICEKHMLDIEITGGYNNIHSMTIIMYVFVFMWFCIEP